jgi:hypothetical protein
MSPREDIAGSVLKKIAIAARLFGKELQRNKLKWFNLRRADCRLGEKAYATGTAYREAELVSRLDGVRERLTQSRRQNVEAAPSLSGDKPFRLIYRPTVRLRIIFSRCDTIFAAPAESIATMRVSLAVPTIRRLLAGLLTSNVTG